MAMAPAASRRPLTAFADAERPAPSKPLIQGCVQIRRSARVASRCVTARIGPRSAEISGKVTLTNVSLGLHHIGDGRDAAIGFACCGDVLLTEEGYSAIALNYTVEA